MSGVTHGHLMDGRVSYAQPAEGFRSGIEPVLLAAAIPARPGQHVIEGGSGAGAALLCLSARVAGLTGLGVERAPELAALAAENAAANGFTGLRFQAADLTMTDLTRERFDHAFANPPYHRGGTPSPSGAREAAKRADATTISAWTRALAGTLRTGGTLTLILPAASLPEAIAAMTGAACGSVAVLPLWPRSGVAAKLMLLRGVRGGRGGARLCAGLVMHQDGGFTADAEAVLRHVAPIGL